MIYRPRISDVDIPLTTLSRHVLADARHRGDAPALIDGPSGRVLTYAELDDVTSCAAAGLAEIGVAPGDVVALMSFNQPDWAVAAHAVSRAGAVLTPLNPMLTVDETAKQLTHSRAVMIISSSDVEEKCAQAAAQVGIRHRLVLAEHAETAGAQPFTDIIGEARLEAEDAQVDPTTALAVLPYSSGTTGESKGVMLTHRNLVANLEQLRPGWRLTDSDVVCAALPFYHIYGFTIILNSALLAGATIVTLPRFELRAYLEAVQRFGVTRGHLAPPMVLALANAPEVEDFDLTSMRTAVSGAAPLDEEAVARAELRTGIVIRQGYGMTEASPGTHIVDVAEFEHTPAGSVGRLMPATEARVVDPSTGADVAPGERGELLIRGPQVMRGYLNNPEASAATITDGWLHTGDIVLVEGENFYVVDRLKELIKYKGYQIAPAELEAVLLTHPNVVDAAVVRMAHPAGGEAPKAFVVADGAIESEALMQWVANRVAPYKKIRSVVFVDAIPKSPAGKILRRVLQDT